MNTKAWYTEFFDEDYLQLYLPIYPAEQTRIEAERIIQLLNLPQGAKILDLCCGYGRHAIEFAKRGYEVTGFDLSGVLLQRAKADSELAGVEVHWVQGDMRELPFEAKFDAVINVFSSFGYLESDEEDQRVLEQVSKVLKPGGLFLQQIANQEAFVRTFQPASITRFPDELIVVDERELNALTSRVYIHVTMLYPDGRRTSKKYDMRIYSPIEVVKMLRISDLGLEKHFGSLDGAELTINSVFFVTMSRKKLWVER